MVYRDIREKMFGLVSKHLDSMDFRGDFEPRDSMRAQRAFQDIKNMLLRKAGEPKEVLPFSELPMIKAIREQEELDEPTDNPLGTLEVDDGVEDSILNQETI